MYTDIAAVVFGLVGLGVVGCAASKEPARPTLPLCFVEYRTGRKVFIEHIGKDISPIPLKEVLLLPYFSAYSRKRGQHERVVARPFVYRPQTTLPVVPEYSPGYSLRGVAAICPGYLPSSVALAFYYQDKIDGKMCQLVDITKAISEKQANRVLLDFKYLLSQKEVTLGTTRNPMDIGEDERYVYALSTDLRTPTDDEYCTSDKPQANAPIWSYEHGTKLSVDLTDKEVKLVNEFFERSLHSTDQKPQQSKGTKVPE